VAAQLRPGEGRPAAQALTGPMTPAALGACCAPAWPRTGCDASADLRERVRRATVDTDMVAGLEEIRLRLLEGRKSHEPDAPRGELLYGEAFRGYGIDLTTLGSAEAAARIRGSAIRATLLAFLYDWMFYWESGADRARLRAVLDLADDDAWRRRLRSALAVYDAAKREELLTAPEARYQPPILVAGLVGLLIRGPQGEAAQALLHQAQQRHPEDFWINYQMGYLLQEERPREAAGYLRAAVASRPDSSQAQILLGRALRDAGEADEAITAFRKAITLNPNRTGARDLARVLAPGARPRRRRGPGAGGPGAARPSSGGGRGIYLPAPARPAGRPRRPVPAGDAWHSSRCWKPCPYSITAHSDLRMRQHGARPMETFPLRYQILRLLQGISGGSPEPPSHGRGVRQRAWSPVPCPTARRAANDRPRSRVRRTTMGSPSTRCARRAATRRRCGR
jgi:tetratricopeptide (TPR) repeat protein